MTLQQNTTQNPPPVHHEKRSTDRVAGIPVRTHEEVSDNNTIPNAKVETHTTKVADTAFGVKILGTEHEETETTITPVAAPVSAVNPPRPQAAIPHRMHVKPRPVHPSQVVNAERGQPAQLPDGLVPVEVSPANDRIKVTLSLSNEAPDLDNPVVDVRQSARAITADVSQLKETLQRLGANIQIDLPGYEQLATSMQEDYKGVHEYTLTYQYQDHLGHAFDEKINLPVTQENMVRVEKALIDADVAAKKMDTQLRGGQTISQDEISSGIRASFKPLLEAQR